MTLLEFLQRAVQIIGILFLACYAYQILYVPVALTERRKKHDPVPVNRYAVLVSARNEEAVIAQLVESIRNQDYPAEYLTAFVIADNCTDGTADAARKAGAVVYERFDRVRVGKGYALNELLRHIREDYGEDFFDGFFVFDADNLLAPDYVSRMNETFQDGYNIVTSYRNSKNFGDNWLSAGYALWFLRDSAFLNAPRARLGVSAMVSGTGFLFSREIVQRNDGWPFHSLSEDTEFTLASIIQGERVGYCGKAEFYDEQPTKFSQSWRQRMRWVKGNMQVLARFGGRLTAGIIGKNSMSCIDVLLSIPPAIVLTIISVLLGGATALLQLLSGQDVLPLLLTAASSFLAPYIMLFTAGCITTATQWRHINAPGWKKILYTFTFPLFIATYVPITIAALFCRVTWRPIEHKAAVAVRGTGKAR